MDYEALARELMRALRGRRSQTAFSRRLGYKSNVAYTWESGRRFPTAAETFRAAARCGVDVKAAMAAFFRELPREAAALGPSDPQFAAALLRAMNGGAPVQRLAERSGLTRSSVSRVLSGKTEPRLPAFLRLVDLMTRRVLDLLAGFVDLDTMDAARDEWRRLDQLRRLVTESPLFESVPRFLELDAYKSHRPGWIAERLGISVAEEEQTLRGLEEAGLIVWDGKRWRVDRERSFDTSRFGPRAGASLRAHWAEAAAGRIRANEGSFAYLVFTADDATLLALRELQLRYFQELRALVARVPRDTRVAVANMHLFALDGKTWPTPGGSKRG